MTYATRYRAFLILNGNRTALSGTTERKTKSELFRLIKLNSATLLATLSDKDLDSEMLFKAGFVSMGSAKFFLDFIPAHEIIR